jgi:hypothetical protein
MIDGVSRITVELQRPGEPGWDFVGSFTASESAIAALRELLEGREPYEVLGGIRAIDQLLFDTLAIIKSEGWAARVSFIEDH